MMECVNLWQFFSLQCAASVQIVLSGALFFPVFITVYLSVCLSACLFLCLTQGSLWEDRLWTEVFSIMTFRIHSVLHSHFALYIMYSVHTWARGIVRIESEALDTWARVATDSVVALLVATMSSCCALVNIYNKQTNSINFRFPNSVVKDKTRARSFYICEENSN